MKSGFLAPMAVGLALGAGAVALWSALNAPAPVSAPPAVAATDTTALDAARRRIADLEERLRALESANPPPIPTPTPEERAADPAAAAATDLKGLLQDSRPLLTRMTPMFKEWMSRGIERQVDALAADLGLDDTQKAALKAKLTGLGDEEMRKFQQRLNDPTITPDKLFQPQSSPFQPEVLEAALKETLTPDQFAQHQKQQTEEKVERLERQANTQVERMGRRLNLTESQKDQVFGIMVKSSDPALEVETATGTTTPPPADPADRNAAIRAILTPDQQKLFDEDVRREDERRSRWSRMFGGGAP